MKIKRTAKGNYQVTMNEAEARTMYALSGSVIGSIKKSPRGHSDKFFDLMEEVLDIDALKTTEGRLIAGIIEFKDYPNE